jgi:hypothetical protein
MPRWLPALLAFLLLAIAGCGGDSADKADSPLDEALGYLPKDAPFVVAIDTDLQGSQYRALGDLVGKIPFGDQIAESLKGRLETGDVDFDKDVRPLLGNRFVVGATDAESFASDADTDDFVGAIQAKDGAALDDLLERDKPKEVGEKAGATLYEDDDGDRFAVKDDVFVVAGSDELLDQALERRNGDDKLDEADFDDALEGLAEDALLRAYFDLDGLIAADPDTRGARRVKWVSAVRELGLTASAEADAVSVDFNQRTEGDLGERDLPLAPGSGSPSVVQHGDELNLGVRDLGRIIDFALAAGQAVEGSGVEAGKRQFERRLGIDLEDDVIAQLGGDASANIAPDGGFGVRAELKDPSAFRETLRKVAPTLAAVAEGAGADAPRLVRPSGGDDLYTLRQRGGDEIVFGVLGDVLVVANDRGRARRLASETPRPVAGAEGAVVASADVERLAKAVLEQFGRQLGPLGAVGGELFTGSLGDLRLSLESSTESLTGSFRLTFD